MVLIEYPTEGAGVLGVLATAISVFERLDFLSDRLEDAAAGESASSPLGERQRLHSDFVI